jgi:hypothetical protein
MMPNHKERATIKRRSNRVMCERANKQKVSELGSEKKSQ